MSGTIPPDESTGDGPVAPGGPLDEAKLRKLKFLQFKNGKRRLGQAAEQQAVVTLLDTGDRVKAVGAHILELEDTAHE